MSPDISIELTHERLCEQGHRMPLDAKDDLRLFTGCRFRVGQRTECGAKARLVVRGAPIGM